MKWRSLPTTYNSDKSDSYSSAPNLTLTLTRLLHHSHCREGAAQTGAPHQMHNAAAKAGLVNLTKSFARELAPHIRVNCVAHGLTLTEMGEDTIRVSEPPVQSLWFEGCWD